MSNGDRFQEDRDKYHVYAIDEDCLELVGGGNYYDEPDALPDDETYEEAHRLATKYGMSITGASGRWEGWSEYTPDPGDISHFDWEKDE